MYEKEETLIHIVTHVFTVCNHNNTTNNTSYDDI